MDDKNADSLAASSAGTDADPGTDADADPDPGANPDPGARQPIRTAIVDDHPVTRQGIAAVLAGSGRFEIGATVSDAGELADPGGFGLILLDLYLTGDEPCLETVAEFAARTKVLVISASRRRGDALAVLQAGACGYLTKHSGVDVILRSALDIADGFALSADLADFLSADLADPALHDAVALGEPLSQRQHQALDLIAEGYTHAQAARRMGISLSTLDTHVKRIREKLHIGNKADLTRAALILRQARAVDRPDGPV